MSIKGQQIQNVLYYNNIVIYIQLRSTSSLSLQISTFRSQKILISYIVLLLGTVIISKIYQAYKLKHLPKIQYPQLNQQDLIQGKLADNQRIKVIEIFELWCKPCRNMTKHVEQLFQQYKNQDVHILAITESNKEQLEQFINQNQLTYNILRSSLGNQLLRQCGGLGIPFSLLFVDNQLVWTGHPIKLHNQIDIQLNKLQSSCNNEQTQSEKDE